MQDEFFMAKALKQAEIALSAGEFPVGCVITNDENILVSGFRQKSAGDRPNEIDHAEITALRRLMETSISGRRGELSIYVTMEPCLMCFGAILLANIQKIVYAYEDVMGGGTRCRLADLPSLYADAGVRIIPHVLRSESLALFKAFFTNPDNAYWKNSPLAVYTLSQK